MHPVLIEIGPFTIYSFGFFLASAFLLGIAWTMREARLRNLDERLALDIGFYVLVGGLLGARISFAVFNPHLFFSDPWSLFKLWTGGLIFMGGAFTAAMFMVFFLRLKKQPILAWLDAAAPGAALGLFLGWLGCLASGCGYGMPAELLWSITFTHPHAAGPLFTPLHPTQAYHALAALACFVFILSIKGNFHVQGRLAGAFLIMYSLLGMLIDHLRADIQAELYFLSLNQAGGVAGVVAGLVLFYVPAKTWKG